MGSAAGLGCRTARCERFTPCRMSTVRSRRGHCAAMVMAGFSQAGDRYRADGGEEGVWPRGMRRYFSVGDGADSGRFGMQDVPRETSLAGEPVPSRRCRSAGRKVMAPPRRGEGREGRLSACRRVERGGLRGLPPLRYGPAGAYGGGGALSVSTYGARGPGRGVGAPEGVLDCGAFLTVPSGALGGRIQSFGASGPFSSSFSATVVRPGADASGDRAGESSWRDGSEGRTGRRPVGQAAAPSGATRRMAMFRFCRTGPTRCPAHRVRRLIESRGMRLLRVPRTFAPSEWDTRRPHCPGRAFASVTLPGGRWRHMAAERLSTVVSLCARPLLFMERFVR